MTIGPVLLWRHHMNSPSSLANSMNFRSTLRKIAALIIITWSVVTYLQPSMFDDATITAELADRGCPCSWPQQTTLEVGDTEKRQLVYYVANRSHVHQHLPSSAHHTLSINVTTPSPHCATITLTDTRHEPHRKLGGANLRTIVSTDNHLYACPYVDHFNGSYDVICTLPLDDHLKRYCYDVTVTLMYQDFGAYRWDGIMINTTIFTTQLCSERHDTFNISNPEAATHCSNSYTGWYRRDSHVAWQWLRKGVTQQSLGSVQQTTDCFRHRSHTIYLIADSHLRRIYDYWIYTAVSRPVSMAELVHVSYMLSEAQIPGFDEWSILPLKRGFAEKVMKLSHLLTELERWRMNDVQLQNDRQHQTTTFQPPNASTNKQSVFSLQHSTLSAKTVLVLSFGLWDVAFRNISQVVAYAMPALSHWLHAIRDELINDRVRVVIFTPPAQSENVNFSNPHYPENRIDLRNNALVAALVSLLRDAVRDKITGARVIQNVDLVDYFAMTFPRRGESYDGVHYVQPFPRFITDDVVRNSLGFDVERFLKYEICKDVLPHLI